MHEVMGVVRGAMFGGERANNSVDLLSRVLVAFAVGQISALRPSNTGNIFVQLVAQQCCRCKLRLFVGRITTFSRNKISCCR